MTEAQKMQWVAIDWGTTNVRAWAMDENSNAIDLRRSDRGMKSLQPDEYEDVLLDLIGDWWDCKSQLDVVICGMAGAKTGWMEAPYRQLHTNHSNSSKHFVAPVLNTPLLNVAILAGLAQSEPADVMRGEETQIAGFLASHSGFTGAVCCPGTHSKWVTIDGGEVQNFQSYMTGEIFALLCNDSILSLSLSKEGWDEGIAEEAISNLSSELGNLGRYFSLRASDMMGLGGTPVTRRTLLSVWIIADEIRDMLSHNNTQNIALIGAGALTEIYATILNKFGRQAEIIDPETVTLNGLVAAYSKLAQGE